MLQRIFQSFDKQAFLKYFKNTSWMMVERIFMMAVAMLVGLWVARYLGVQRYGLLNYVISYTGLFSAIASFGVKDIFLRDVAIRHNTRATYLGTTFLLHLMGGLLAVAVVGTSFLIRPEEWEIQKYILIASLAFVFHSFWVIEYYFQATVQAKYSSTAQMLMILMASVFRLMGVYFKLPIEFFIWMILIEQVLYATNMFLFNHLKGIKVTHWKFDKKLAVNLLKQSWFFMFSGIAVTIYMKIDQVMLRNMLNDEANGFYAAAVKLSEAWYFIPVVVANSLVPAISYAKEKDEKLYYDRLQKLYNLLAWIAVGIAVVITLLGGWIIDLFIPEYTTSVPVLQVHIWAAVFVFLGVGSDKWLIQERYYRVSLLRTVSGAVLNIILNLYLIPLLGIFGAAYATLFSYAFSSYFVYAFLKGKRLVFYMQTKALFFPVIFVFRKLKIRK
ncbi:flippase [Rapidithrix thailandica]|uniref:Flippase n=1 Tax=Rapidithrix thailandica TaxID=413964 RepID=A0AAW9S4L6_9BACT